jgi:galactose mutarotase-like enzyme
MASSVSRTAWHGVAAWAIEGDTHRVVMVPDMGAKIVSLVDKRDGFEWVVGAGPRPVKPVAYGALWHEQDMAGWDEMFPTIIACPYPGAGPLHGTPLPDHGEAWTLPWVAEQTGEGELALTLIGRALPYHLTRQASFAAPNTLRLNYTLVNLSTDAMPYIWAAHAQFVAGLDGEIVFPAAVTEVINTIPESWGWGPPETHFDWPEATAVDGRRVRIDQVGAPSLHQGRKLFALPHVRPSWAAVLRRTSGHWLRFEWNPQEVPYLGLWVDEGALNHESVAAPEPTTGWYDNLAMAWDKREVTIVPAGATRQWTLTVRLGTDGNPVPDDAQ